MPFGSCFPGEVGSEFTIVEVRNHNFTAENAGTRKWASTDLSADCCIVELLGEEPTTPAKCEGKPGQVRAYIDGRAQWVDQPLQDTRTEITWENATMEDHVVAGLLNHTQTVRELVRGLRFIQPGEPIKMALSQIEEKLGHKVEIVE